MQTFVPPIIPPSVQFNTIQNTNTFKNKGSSIINGNNIVTGNFTMGGILLDISGQSQTYSASSVAAGMLTRSGLTVSISNDVMPSASDLANALGLIAGSGNSYIRLLGIYNTTAYQIDLTGDGWTFVNSNSIRGQFGYTLMYNIYYSDGEWLVSCMFTGQIDLS
jgi:hypothetical protein